ncbi:MAG: hypothetical protein HDR06_04445 [Lachnospiraceae bacterium]|nr:hypothetical protein [Lachnospiraceae bacterium]
MIAFTWSGIFLLLIPEHKIFGRLDTFPVYVLHGFIVLFFRKYNPFTYSLPVNLFIASLISITIMLVFGNKYVSAIMRFVFRGEWIIRIWDALIIKRTT